MTFLLVLPLTQVIVAGFAIGLAEALGVGVAEALTSSTSCVNLIRTVGEENVKFLADNVNQPFRSLRTVVDTCAVPSAESTEIDAEIGAFEKPYMQRATSDRSKRS